jgi:photosystem II stability/assembly factor-like uncharacterized protein
MPKRIWSLSFCVAVGLVTAFVLSSTLAQDGGVHETFDNPDLPGWERSPDVTVADGIVRLSPNNFLAVPGVWGDFTLRIRLRRISGDGDLLMLYRASDTASNQLSIHGSGFTLGRTDAGAFNELYREPFGAPATDWFDLTLNVAGSHHTVMFYDQPLIDFTDPGPPLTSASVVLQTHDVTVEVDELDLIPGAEGAPSVEIPTDTQPEIEAEAPPEPPTVASSTPAYQANTWVRLGGPPGGLGYDIRMDPRNPDVMFVTASPGGTFKSLDGGLTWTAQNQGIEPFPGAGASIFCATIDPHNPDRVWVGTQFSGHVYLSTNGGQTWQRRDNGIPEMVGENSIRGITIDPNDPHVVYVAMERGSGLGGTTGEVYKSTDDGENFALIWQGDDLARYVWVDPRDSQRIYVSTGIFDRQAANADPDHNICGGVGIVRSDDSGQTWTVLDYDNGLGSLFIPSLYMHPTNPDILLAAAHKMPYCPDGVPGVYVTRDGGDTWQAVIDPNLNNVDIGFEIVYHDTLFEAVEISETNPDIWYAAGREVFFRSDDAGQTWKAFPLGTVLRKSGVPIDIQVDPRDPYRVFVNNYLGGNFLSTDGGATWTDASSGYSGVKIFGLAVSPADASVVIAGSEDTSFRSVNGGINWDGIGIYEGASSAIATTDNRLIIGITIQDEGFVYSSSDNGQTWVPNRVTEFQSSRILFALALAAAPSDPQTIYTGYTDRACFTGEWVLCADVGEDVLPGIHRSQDGGQTWRPVGEALFSDTSILDLAVSSRDPLTVYAATTKGLFRSTDGGATWRHLAGLEAVAGWGSAGPGAPIPTSYVVAVDPFDPQIIYVGSAHNGVWLSRDGGETWGQASVGMDPNERLVDLLPDPHRPGVIYAASDASGIYVSTNGATTWQKINQGLDFRTMTHLALSNDGSVLYAGSAGAGVFRLGTP